MKSVQKITNETSEGTARLCRLALLCPLLCGALILPGFAGESVDETVVTTEDSNLLPEIGMSMSEVRQLLIGHSVNEELIGGACGMLEVISNDDNSIRVIGVGGVVTSVSEGVNRLDDQNDETKDTETDPNAD